MPKVLLRYRYLPHSTEKLLVSIMKILTIKGGFVRVGLVTLILWVRAVKLVSCSRTTEWDHVFDKHSRKKETGSEKASIQNRVLTTNTNETSVASLATSTISAATTTLSGKKVVCPVTVVIQLDDYPEEIGWSLRCGDDVYGDVAASSYKQRPNERIETTFWIDYKSECEFSITDSYGDGLCCLHDEGYYEVFLGEEKTRSDNNVLVTGADFGMEDDAFFTVKCRATAFSSPSNFPSTTPSTSQSPSSHPPDYATTVTTRPTSLLTPVSVVIQLDLIPEETSWSLECGGVTYANFSSPHYYGLKEHRIEKKFEIETGTECLFIIEDTYEDGICCYYGTGYFQLFVGDMEIKQNLLFEGGEFGAREEIQFTVKPASPTISPMPSPTPSLLPSISPTSTHFPTSFSGE